MITIVDLIEYIETQTGNRLSPCLDFSGIQQTSKDEESYYNFCLDVPYAESLEVFALERLALNSSIISRVEPNGYKRVAVFLKNDS